MTKESNGTKRVPRHGVAQSWWWLAITWAGLTLVGASWSATAAESVSDEEATRLILTRWIEEMGGYHKLRELKWADFNGEIIIGSEPAPIPLYIRAAADGRYRYDYTLPARGRLIQAFDGRSAWQANDELGFGRLSHLDHVANQAGIDFREPIKIAAAFPHRRRLPDETVTGRLLQVVEMGTAEGWKIKWFFDPETGMRVRIEATIGDAPLSVDFSDFRRFQGIREPYRIVRHLGQTTVQVVRHSILYNEPSDASLFVPPADGVRDHLQIESLLVDNDRVMGLASLPEIHSQVIRAVIENQSSGVTIRSTTYKRRPNLLVRQQEAPGLGVEWQGFDGQQGWASSELQGFRRMEGAELAQIVSEADLDQPLRLRQMSTFRRLLGESVVDGRVLFGVAVSTLRGMEGNFYYDRKTSLLARLETEVQAGPSGRIKIVADLSDYRQVGKIKLPFLTVITNPAMRLVTRIEAAELNVALEDSLFAPRKE